MKAEIMTALLIWLALVPQEKVPVRELILELGAESVEQRDAALRKLEAVGKTAVPDLRRAASHSDAEISARAAYLLRLFALRERLTPKLRESLPGVENRLASGGRRVWTTVFLEASSRSRFPFLEPEDLDPLAAAAFRGAASDDERVTLCIRVRRHHLRSAVPEIIPLLISSESRLREQAGQVILDLKPEEAVPAIVELVKTGSPHATKAASLLGRLGASDALPEIRRLMSDPRASVRTAAMVAISSMGDKASVPNVIVLTEDKDPAVRRRALLTLEILRAESAIPAVARRLRDESPSVRRRAVLVLASLRAETHATAVADRLDDADPHVRNSAIHALQWLQAKAFIPEIAGRLSDESSEVRIDAVKALVRLGADRGVEFLPLLRDNDPNVVVAAVWGLASMPTPTASAPLAQLLPDPKVEVRISALLALDRTGMEEVAPAVLKRLEDPKPVVRANAARILGRHRVKASFGELVRRLGDDDALVRTLAAGALGRLGRSDARKPLEALLKDTGNAEASSRKGLDEILGRTESWYVRAVIDDLYRRSHPPVRVAAAQALALLGFRSGVPLILDYAEDTGLGRNCVVLNAARKPALWNRLHAAKVKKPIAGTPLECLRGLASKAGLSVDCTIWVKSLSDKAEVPADGRATIGDAVVSLADRYRFNFILEPDRIRVVPGRECLDFWIAWHAGSDEQR